MNDHPIILFFFYTIISIPFIITLIIFRWLYKSKFKKLGFLFLITASFLMAYALYTSYFPSDSKFIDQFNYYGELDFPSSGKIIKKKTSEYDEFGDCSKYIVFTTNKPDFYKTLKSIQGNKKYTCDTFPYRFSLDSDSLKKQYNESEFTKSFTFRSKDQDKLVIIGFNEKKKLIHSEYSTW